MGLSPPTCIHTNPAEAPRQNADESTPPSITGLAKSALEQGPASAAPLADRVVEPIDQQNVELAKRISENHLTLRNYSSAELDAIAPYLTYADCTDLPLSDEQLQDFISKLTNVEELIIHNMRITNLTIPRNVKKLDCSCCFQLAGIQFAENSQLQKLNCCETDITILNVPATVTELNCDACPQLTSIQFAENSQLQKLNCCGTGITILNVPATVTELNCDDCTQLTSIQFAENSQLQKLNCCKTGITILNVPATVTELYCDTCFRLTSIQFAENSQLQKLNCCKADITTLNVPATVTVLDCDTCCQLTSIQFAENSQIQKLSCPRTNIPFLNVPVTVIELVCDGNSSLTDIQFAENSQLQKLDCRYTDITSLNVPATVTVLLYNDCSNLTSIQFAENSQLQKLDCRYTGITSLNVPATVTEFNCDACPQLTSIQFAENSQLQKLNCCETGITSLNVPATVTQLRCGNCTHLTSIQFAGNSQLQKLICPYTGITSLNVPATVTELVFQACMQLTSIQFAENSQLQTLTCSCSVITTLNVPATVTELYCDGCFSLTNIQFAENSQLQKVFCYKTGITTLNVPATVTLLVCNDCSNLTSIQFTENSQLQTLRCASCPALNNIQCEALPHCSELQYVDCPNLRQLPQLPLTAQVTSESSPSQSFNRMPVDAEVLDQNALAVLLDLGYNYLLRGRFFPSIVFVDSATGTPAGIDLGGLRRHVVATIFKNLIDNEEMFARYDDEVIMRLPKLIPNAGEDMRTAMRTIGHLFALCYSSDTMRTGVYFYPKLFTTILWLMNEENLRLSNLDERIFAQLEGWNYDALDDDTKQAIHDHILERDIVSPVRLIADQMRSVLPHGWQVNVTPEYLQRKIQGLAVNERTLSNAIRWERNSASQEALERMQNFFNTWVARMQQENPQKLDDFVFFTTGNRSIGDARITLSLLPGVDSTRLPIAHTCSLQIDMPVYASQEMFDQKIELALSSMTGFQFG